MGRLIFLAAIIMLSACGDESRYNEQIENAQNFINGNYLESKRLPKILLYEDPDNWGSEPENLISYLNKLREHTSVECSGLRKALAMSERTEFDRRDKEIKVDNEAQSCWKDIQSERTTLRSSGSTFKVLYDLELRDYDFEYKGFNACFSGGRKFIKRVKKDSPDEELTFDEVLDAEEYEVIIFPSYQMYRFFGEMGLGFEYWLPEISGKRIGRDQTGLQQRVFDLDSMDRDCLLYPVPEGEAKRIRDKVRGKRVQLELLIRSDMEEISTGYRYDGNDFENMFGSGVQMLKVIPVGYRLHLGGQSSTDWIPIARKE